MSAPLFDDEVEKLRAAGKLPSTPAGRWEMAMELLAPTLVEECPCCGQSVEYKGEPMISKEAALKLMAGGE